MAMLAGPRRKQKVINLRAKNNAWSNDQNKFGLRMLEKMGWSAGKGLGAKENGIVEHVIARYKNDDKGLGFEDKNDQWTKHEDDFNALLSNLSNATGDDEKLHSGVSLEVKSKKSKARVHYHKFTRGKDLTRYSEKDLANIFGKKSFKEKKAQQEQECLIKEEIKTTEQIFTEKGSMEDYFKNKFAKFKTKSQRLHQNNFEEDDADYAFKGFSTNDENETTDNHNDELDFCNQMNKRNEDLNEVHQESNKPKKKKKHKRQSINLVENIHQYTNEEDLQTKRGTINTDITNIFKNSKKKTNIESENLPEEIKPKKKKSKSKNYHDLQEESNEHNCDDYIPKKKKKKKNKDLEI